MKRWFSIRQILERFDLFMFFLLEFKFFKNIFYPLLNEK